MLKSHLKILLRNLSKNRVYTFVTFTGLIIGFAASLSMIDYSVFELSYDRFHQNFECIYRVKRVDQNINKEWAVSFASLNKELASKFPEVEVATVFCPTDGVFRNLERKIAFRENKLAFTDPEFFSTFSFPTRTGFKAMDLSRPNTVVLSESFAMKYFGDLNVFGRSLTYIDKNFGEQPYEVVGTFEDMPTNSHFRFDALLSINSPAFGSRKVIDLPWGAFYNYVKLKPGAGVSQLNSKIKNILIEKNPNSKETLVLQPIDEIHLYSSLGNELSANNKAERIYFLIGLAIFILFIAYVNYANLTSALALGRWREVGVRKVLGSKRKQLTIQFITESILIHLLCFLMAIGFLGMINPFLPAITDVRFHYSLVQSPVYLILLLIIVIIGAAVSGIYPSLILNSFQPFEMVKGTLFQKRESFDLKKTLIVFQYVISIGMIGATVIAHRQIEFMINHELGMDIDQVLIIRPPAVHGEEYKAQMKTLKDQLARYPMVKSISVSDALPGDTYNYGTQAMRQGDSESKAEYFISDIDATYFMHYQIPVLSGRAFKEELNEIDHVILNETALHQLGFVNPSAAVNEMITVSGRQVTVVGVVKDYHHRSLQFAKDPIVFRFTDRAARFSVRIDPSNGLRGVHEFITTAKSNFLSVFRGNEFEYYFLNEVFDEQYGREFQLMKLLDLFTGLGIFLSAIGLFAFSSYTAKARAKEIAIRKVLGATIFGIHKLLTKEFIYLILIATFISFPIVFYFMSNWLSTFANQIGWTISMFVIPVFSTILFTLISIGFLTIRAALQPPSITLRQ